MRTDRLMLLAAALSGSCLGIACTHSAEENRGGAQPTQEATLPAVPLVDKSQDPDTPASAAKLDRYVIPQGDVSKLVQFIEELQQFRPNTADEMMEHRTKAPAAIKQAAEQILKLEKDRRSPAHRLATLWILLDEVGGLSGVSAEQQAKIYERVKSFLLETDTPSKAELGLALMTADLLEGAGQETLAVSAYKTFGELFSKSSDEALSRMGRKLLGSARRLNIVDSKLALEGKTIDGKTFDWSAYRGKVVLVDFWATWCGPCRDELPNLKQHYQLYHSKGFDVVGISLDTERQVLQEFIKDEQLPWVCLFEDGSGWEHPMAEYYGINAIPTVMLVDQQGKVLTLNARGSELGQELARLLGPVEKPPETPDAKAGEKSHTN